jgi:DNA-binding NtrC family response regulator
MKRPVLDGKIVLVASRNQVILSALERLILKRGPSSRIEGVSTWEETLERVRAWTFDLVVIDLSHARDFDPVKLFTLLNLAERHRFHVVMLTPPGMDPEAPESFFSGLTRVHFAKPVPAEVIETLERVLIEESLCRLMRFARAVQKWVGWSPRISKSDCRRNVFELADDEL